MSASFDSDKRFYFVLQLISKLLITILRSEIDAGRAVLSCNFFGFAQCISVAANYQTATVAKKTQTCPHPNQTKCVTFDIETSALLLV